MSVVLRLTRKGRTHRPFYRIVAADKHDKRDGRFIEMLGTYNTLESPAAIVLDTERVKHWIGKGAIASDTVSQIIDKEIPGFLDELENGQKEKIRSKRAKRKAKGKTKGEKSEAKLRRRAKAENKTPVPAPKQAAEPAEEAAAEATAPEAEATKETSAE